MDTFASLNDLTICLTSHRSEEYAVSSPTVDVPTEAESDDDKHGNHFMLCIIA
jgi:hypothetical protein